MSSDIICNVFSTLQCGRIHGNNAIIYHQSRQYPTKIDQPKVSLNSFDFTKLDLFIYERNEEKIVFVSQLE